MSFNQIIILQVGCFEGIINLKDLSLQHNKLSTDIGHSPFLLLKAVKWLPLGKNNILHFPHTFLTGVQSLQSFELSLNNLSKIEKHYFNNSQHLAFLFLQDNRIEFIETGTFAQHRKLTFLNLKNNKLKCLDREVFLPIQIQKALMESARTRAKMSIYLDKNPIMCRAYANCWITQTDNNFWIYSRCYKHTKNCTEHGRFLSAFLFKGSASHFSQSL